MKKKVRFINIVFLKAVLLIMFFLGCSTQKDAVPNKIYHQLNTKYNGLFYAEKYLAEGIKKVENTHKDNYKQLLSINKYGDMKGAKSAQASFDKAIEKSTVAIQHHSMDINGDEKNKLIDENYIIIGKAQFYKQEYAPSINTFNFLVRKSNNEELKSEALIWATRCHQALNNKEALRKNITLLEEDYFLNKQQDAILDQIQAESAIAEGYYLEAKQYLNKALAKTKNKHTKIRMYYILGQLHLLLEEHQNALEHFNKVIKKNPTYEMVFNAKLMRAQTYVIEGGSFLELSEGLEKMINDRKNEEYKDQIYFALAQLQLKNKDTLNTINSLKLSTKHFINNNNQKLASHHLLANLFWNQQEYINAYHHCDSAYQIVDKKSPDYDNIKKMLRSSKKIAKRYNTINYNDSIIELAKLPEADRIEFIDAYIAQLKQQDLAKKTPTDRPSGGNFNPYDYNRQTQNSMNITSGGGWYFYNPSAMSLGYSEFLSRWGNRKLEDNWRRKNKNEVFSENDLEDDDSTNTPTEKEKYSRDYYLEQLPLEEEEQLVLLSKIEAAYYDLGSLFKEEVEDYPQAILIYNELVQRFPSTDYMQLIYFDLYSVYVLQGDEVKSREYLQKIENDYPESNYLEILKGNIPTNSKLELDKKIYQQAHSLYTDFSIKSCEDLAELLSKNSDNTFVAQMELLNAFCQAKKSEKNDFIKNLEIIQSTYPNHKISKKIDSIILILKGELALEKDNIYDNEFNSPHYFIITIADLNINLPETQLSISKFNNDTHKLDSLETINLLLTKNDQLLRVGDFKNKETAEAYYELIKNHETTKEIISNKNIQTILISENNYTKLLIRKDINEYIEYFNEIYLLN